MTRSRKVKRALKEAKMNVKDTKNSRKVRKCMGINQLLVESLQMEVCGVRGERDLAKYIRSRFKNIEIWDRTEVKQRSPSAKA